MKVLSVILGVLLVVSGIYCVLTPGATFLSLALIIGISMVVSAVGGLCEYGALRKLGRANGWTLAGGILSLLLGLFLISSDLFKFYTDVMIAYTAGLWVFVLGVIRIVFAIKLYHFRKGLAPEARGSVWIWMLILGIVMCVFGIYGLFQPALMALAIGMLMGAYIVVSGVNLIAAAFAPSVL